MKVRELIEKLKLVEDQNLDVQIMTGGNSDYAHGVCVEPDAFAFVFTENDADRMGLEGI
jgi:hypothetical protein